RPQHSLRAIVASQAAGSRGAEPLSNARCAERNTCCVASSASARLRRSAWQRPPTVRAYSSYSASVHERAAPGEGRLAAENGSGALVATTAAVVVAARVVVVVPLALVVLVVEREVERHRLADDRARQRQARRQRYHERLPVD